MSVFWENVIQESRPFVRTRLAQMKRQISRSYYLTTPFFLARKTVPQRAVTSQPGAGGGGREGAELSRHCQLDGFVLGTDCQCALPSERGAFAVEFFSFFCFLKEDCFLRFKIIINLFALRNIFKIKFVCVGVDEGKKIIYLYLRVCVWGGGV